MGHGLQPMDRLSRFLSYYKFYPNSIDFRIHSSKAIEKWKNVQSFQLNQIANGKFHFHKHKKEILLLKYDLWSRFIYEVENLMIDLSNNHLENEITREHIDTVVELADKTTSVYKDIILVEHSDRFNTEFSEVWIEAHDLIYSMMIHQIRGLIGFSYDIAFTAMVDIVAATMQYTLIELHELNSLFCFYGEKCDQCFPEKDDQVMTPFMIITKTDETSFALTNRYLVVERFKIYKRHFDIQSVFFKNYSGQRIPREIFDSVEKMGVDIKYKLNY